MTKKKKEDANFVISKCDNTIGFTKNEKGEIRIVFTNYYISNRIFNTFESAEEYVKSKPYELFINIMFVITEIQKKYGNNTTATEIKPK